MRIGELASRAAVSRDSLRFYERLGLIRARRSANGYRDYPEESLQALLYIKTAQHLGFALAEIGEQLETLWSAPDRDQAVQELLTDKLQRIEQRMEELAALRDELRQRLASGCPLQPRPR